jgi:hypothetical protein
MITWIKWRLAFVRGFMKAFWLDMKYPSGLVPRALGHSSNVKVFLAWNKQWHLDNAAKKENRNDISQ